MQLEAPVEDEYVPAAHAAQLAAFDADEYVPAAQLPMTVSVVGVHGVVTLWPAMGVVQAWQVGSGELGFVEKYAPEQTHAEWSLLETECTSVQEVQLEVMPVPCSEYEPCGHALQLAADCAE